MTAPTVTAAPSRSATDREVEDLVRAHLPLVGHLVRELASRLPAHVNREDLVSAGMAALAAAAKGFDPDRGTPFGSSTNCAAWTGPAGRCAAGPGGSKPHSSS
jgi:RNA polymerase sigma factor for flagellar operon FliA